VPPRAPRGFWDRGGGRGASGTGMLGCGPLVVTLRPPRGPRGAENPPLFFLDPPGNPPGGGAGGAPGGGFFRPPQGGGDLGGNFCQNFWGPRHGSGGVETQKNHNGSPPRGPGPGIRGKRGGKFSPSFGMPGGQISFEGESGDDGPKPAPQKREGF